MRSVSTTGLSDNEKLEALRELDQFRQWDSLDDERCCLVCGKLINGQLIQLVGGTRDNEPLRLRCPTQDCNSIPMDWVLPTREILARVETIAAEEREPSQPKSAAMTISNGEALRTVDANGSFMSRLRRFASYFKRHS